MRRGSKPNLRGGSAVACGLARSVIGFAPPQITQVVRRTWCLQVQDSCAAACSGGFPAGKATAVSSGAGGVVRIVAGVVASSSSSSLLFFTLLTPFFYFIT